MINFFSLSSARLNIIYCSLTGHNKVYISPDYQQLSIFIIFFHLIFYY